jgi:hypothetical protein
MLPTPLEAIDPVFLSISVSRNSLSFPNLLASSDFIAALEAILGIRVTPYFIKKNMLLLVVEWKRKISSTA